MARDRHKLVQQQDLFINTKDLPRSESHSLSANLNRLHDETGADTWSENLYSPYYRQVHDRRGIPKSVYFRMLLAGYFEGIQSERGTAWLRAESL